MLKYDFLTDFAPRMQSFGYNALLVLNSKQKAIWKEMGFETDYEQINVDFMVLIYIMEQTVRSEICTIDDITDYFFSLCKNHLHKPLSYDDCHKLCDYIVNVILSNEGKPMEFKGFDFETNEYKTYRIRYIGNKIEYTDKDTPRTSYYITEAGYTLILNTREVESNMQIPIQQMITQLHIKNGNYAKALETVKNLFKMLRVQIQKSNEAIACVKRNVLDDYSTAEYEAIQKEDLSLISDSREEFRVQRELVRNQAQQIEETNTSVTGLDEKSEQNLRDLREIDRYLSESLDEFQKIQQGHYKLREIYMEHLDWILEMENVKRINFRKEIFEPVLDNPAALSRLELLLHPLLLHHPDKIFTLDTVFEAQQVKIDEESEESVMDILVDENDADKIKEEEYRRTVEQYSGCIKTIIDLAMKAGGTITLEEINQITQANQEVRSTLIPSIHIFINVLREFAWASPLLTADIVETKKKDKRKKNAETSIILFDEILLSVLRDNPDWKGIEQITTEKIHDSEPVALKVSGEEGDPNKVIRSYNLRFTVQQREGVQN